MCFSYFAYIAESFIALHIIDDMLHIQYIKHFEFVTLNPDVPADQSIEQAIIRRFF